MAESYKKVSFEDNNQSVFLAILQKNSHLKNKDISSLLKISERTWRDWRRGKYLMPYESLITICTKTNTPLPNNIKQLDQFWHIQKAAKAGGHAKYKKYGMVCDPKIRLEKWQDWVNNGGIGTKILSHPKTVILPKASIKLAEFFGIMMGDGGITKNQINVSLHSKDDLEYSKFVSALMHELFGITPGVIKRTDTLCISLYISRVQLVRYLNNLGLKIGDKIKQNVDIPKWILDNPAYQIACIRGLVDTDGCIFKHEYFSNGKKYRYTKLAFTSASEPLRNSVSQILFRLGMKPRLNQEYDLRLESKKDFKRYFQKINSHNPKHLKKWESIL